MHSGLELELIKYRDSGMHTYTYFWASKSGFKVVSPYFDTEQEAKEWLETTWDNWKSIKDVK